VFKLWVLWSRECFEVVSVFGRENTFSTYNIGRTSCRERSCECFGVVSLEVRVFKLWVLWSCECFRVVSVFLARASLFVSREKKKRKKHPQLQNTQE